MSHSTRPTRPTRPNLPTRSNPRYPHRASRPHVSSLYHIVRTVRTVRRNAQAALRATASLILLLAMLLSPFQSLKLGSNSLSLGAPPAFADPIPTSTTDVFLHKAVFGTGDYPDASAVTDGNDNTYWGDHAPDHTAYVRVDMGKEMPIYDVKVKQYDPYYATQLTVSGGYTENGVWVDLGTVSATSAGWIDIPVSSSVAYRYYRFTAGGLINNSNWDIYTMQGFSAPPPPPPPPSDLFQGKPANGTGSYNPPRYANDGDDASAWSDQYVHGDIWWSVDLTSRTVITDIRIFQHPNYYAPTIRVEGSPDTEDHYTVDLAPII